MLKLHIPVGMMLMMYAYMTLNDGTEIRHSPTLSDKDGKKVMVYFERQSELGAEVAICEIPSYKWMESVGFSEEEMEFFSKFLHSNEHLILKYAENGGIGLANPV